MDFVSVQSGFDVYYPGCDNYYKQYRPSYYPYLTYGLMKAWHPRNARSEMIEHQHRLFPTSMEEACAYGNLASVITFWAQGQEVRNRICVYEDTDATPLMWAALRGHQHVIRFLLDQGVDVNAANSLGHTALLWAITGGHYEIVHLLIDNGAKISQKDKQGYNAYFLAVQNNNLPMLHMVCGCRPIGRQEEDEDGHSLMHWAAYNNSPVICQYLVDICCLKIDTPDNNGRTPLIWAAREGYAEVIEYLLSVGARTDLKDTDGYTALQYAQYRNHQESVYVLTRYSVSRSTGFTSPRNDGQLHSPLSSKGYTSVCEKRRYGTIKMMLHQPLFFFMSLVGVVHVLLSFLITKFIPPILSHVVLGPFFFKNSLWMLLLGYPIQGGKPELTPMQKMGVASNFADSVRGIWLFRNRDASCFFALITFLIVQQYAWAKIGLDVTVWKRPAEVVLTRTSTGIPSPPVIFEIFRYFFNDWTVLQRIVVSFHVFSLALSMVLCKLSSMYAVHESTTSSFKTSPVWTLIKQRAYRWLHPRILWVDRHTMIPLRTFYCYERDVLLHRFDGYSIALDCPIAENNHVYFFLFLYSFTCIQWVTFLSAWNGIGDLLQCPEATTFNQWFFGSLWNMLFYGLPCREQREAYNAGGGWIVWLHHIMPTAAGHLGVWLLQFTLLAAMMSTFVLLRQLAAAARGATRMELANPTATSTMGGLVNIFPRTLSTSMPWVDPDSTMDETVKMDPGQPVGFILNDGKDKRRSFYCIYSGTRNAFLNILIAVCGLSRLRWKDAMAITPTNSLAYNIAPLAENEVL